MKTTIILSALCINLQLFSGCAFTAPSRTARPATAMRSTVEETPSSPPPPPPSSSDDKPSSSIGTKNACDWEVKQHLYGLEMINEAKSGGMSVTMEADGQVGDGDALPLPETYITCGKCKSLFAIADADLGEKGKGCRVKCSVCGNSWYQSRDRLFDIPTTSHDLLPASNSDLERVARNLARDIPPAFMGVGKLYVGNLDFRTTPEELQEFFESNSAGDVTVCDVSIVQGPDGRSRGFAFVSFYEEADGKAALECNGKECNGRELSVREPNN